MASDSVVLAIGSDHCIFHVNRMATNNFYVRQVEKWPATTISQTGIEAAEAKTAIECLKRTKFSELLNKNNTKETKRQNQNLLSLHKNAFTTKASKNRRKKTHTQRDDKNKRAS